MCKKFLYCTAILSITSLGSINNIYASTLQELFKNSNNKVVFENGVISCNDKTLDEDDYIHENNTTFIDINTLPIYIDTNTLSIQSNSGGGEVFINILANIEGSNNISLQDFGNTNNVPNSITFCGNNTQYDGIFYLHPDINTITFETENSLIKRLNIPSINNQIRDITINIPNNLYASIMNIVKVPDNLSITFLHKSTKQVLPEHEKLQNLIKHCSECSECQDTLNLYKITSKSYEKYKQSEIKDLEEILHILQDLLTKLKLNNDNNNENINNIQINEDTNIEELLEKITNILNQLGINEDNNNENIDTNNVQDNIEIKEEVNIKELIKDISKLNDNIIKASVKDRIVNILVKQYIKSFSKRLELLGYKVELNKMHNKIIIKNERNGNKYKIRLEGEDTLEVVEKVVKDLASNFTVEAIKDVVEDSKKEKEEEVAEERERIRLKLDNDLSKLKVKDFKYKIEGIENILEILEKLIEKVERNKEQDINKEMKNLLPSKDKNWININKEAKENLKILKEKTESDMLSEMNSGLTTFKDSYGYADKFYKTKANSKEEIKGTIGDLKKCIDRKIDNITSSSNQEIKSYNRMVQAKENEIKQEILSSTVNHFKKLLGNSDSSNINVTLANGNVKINGSKNLTFNGKNDNDENTTYKVLVNDSNNLVIQDNRDDETQLLLIDTSKSNNEIVQYALNNVETYQKQSVANTITSFFRYFKVPYTIDITKYRINTIVKYALRSCVILGSLILTYKMLPNWQNRKFNYEVDNKIIFAESNTGIVTANVTTLNVTDDFDSTAYEMPTTDSTAYGMPTTDSTAYEMPTTDSTTPMYTVPIQYDFNTSEKNITTILNSTMNWILNNIIPNNTITKIFEWNWGSWS